MPLCGHLNCLNSRLSHADYTTPASGFSLPPPCQNAGLNPSMPVCRQYPFLRSGRGSSNSCLERARGCNAASSLTHAGSFVFFGTGLPRRDFFMEQTISARQGTFKGHNDPSSATRPTRAHDCNLDAMAGFAAARGCVKTRIWSF